MIAASTSVQAQAIDPYVDEILKSDFYGPILDEMKLGNVAVSPTQNCCTTIKTWGDIGLFAGRFDQVNSQEHNGRPVYRAAAGELKIFFNAILNRWTVSDEGKRLSYSLILQSFNSDLNYMTFES